MADQTVEIDLSLQVEGAGGAQGPVRLADLQKADPAAGPGALEGTQAALLAALTGRLDVDVGNFPAVQPVTVAALPLPAGAATEATVLTLLGRTPALNGDGGAPAHVTNFPASQDVAVANFPATWNVSDRAARLLGHVTVDNPPDLSALSTGARQDAQTALLTALAGVDYATGADVADLATRLDAIAANTADIKLDADHLSIEADAINLNTDGVEGRLDTLNAKDFATQATLAQLKARGDLLASEATLAALSGKLPGALVGGRLDVNLGASGVTLGTDPTDRAARLLGHVTVDNPSLAVTAAALPLPAGAATAARQDALAALLPAALDGDGGLRTHVMNLPAAPLTDAQLRATPVPVDTELSAAGPLAIEATQASVLAALQTAGGLAVNTELPAAAALSDATANPSAPMVGSALMGWNSGNSQWARLLLAAALTDANGGQMLGTGNYIYNGAAWDRLRSAAGAPTGTAAVALRPATSGGLSSFRLLSAATVNLTSVKGSAGQVYGWTITNTSAAMKFVKLYNKATAPVIANDAALILHTLAIPAGQTVTGAPSHGMVFSAGVGFAVTGAVGDTDATAVAANDVIVNLLYA